MPPIIIDSSQTKIKAVTVFKDGGVEVTRTFTVGLEVGQNVVKIKSIPGNIDFHTARMTVNGDAAVLIIEGTFESNRDNAVYRSKEEANKQERDRAMGQKHALEQKAELLTKFSQSLSGRPANPGDVSTNTLLERFLEIADAISDLDIKIAELDCEANNLKEEQKRKSHILYNGIGEATAVVMAKRAECVELELKYYVDVASSWFTGYNLHATTENGFPVGPVTLTYYAEIEQETEEDWEDVAVTLATAKPEEYVSLPRLSALRVETRNRTGWMNQPVGAVPIHNPDGPAQSLLPYQSQSLDMLTPPLLDLSQTTPAVQVTIPQNTVPTVQQISPVSDTFSEWQTDVYDMEMAIMDTVPICANRDLTGKKHVSAVTFNGMLTSFRVGGTWSIPSDGDSHRVPIATLSSNATVQYVAVPRIGKSAFLQYEMTNTSEYRLFFACATVYLNNTYTSTTWIPRTNPGEKFLCTLGTDPGIRIEYARSRKAFPMAWTRTVYSTTTTLLNTHPFAIGKVILQDSLPLPPKDTNTPGATTQHVQVKLKEPKGLVDAKTQTYVNAVNKSPKGGSSKVKVGWVGEDWEDTKKYEWVASVGAGEEIKVDTEFEIFSHARIDVELVEEKENPVIVYT